MTRKADVNVFESLSIIQVRGYDPTEPDAHHGGLVDRPGDANWLLETYGMSGPELTGPGVLWQDYDGPEWDFAILINTAEVAAFQEHATWAGYKVLSIEPIDEPTNFGDGGGTVEILKHRHGWVVLD